MARGKPRLSAIVGASILASVAAALGYFGSVLKGGIGAGSANWAEVVALAPALSLLVVVLVVTALSLVWYALTPEPGGRSFRFVAIVLALVFFALTILAALVIAMDLGSAGAAGPFPGWISNAVAIVLLVFLTWLFFRIGFSRGRGPVTEPRPSGERERAAP